MMSYLNTPQGHAQAGVAQCCFTVALGVLSIGLFGCETKADSSPTTGSSATTAAATGAASSSAPGGSATEIVKATVAAYGALSSYADRGLYERRGGPVPTMKSFETQFKRPDYYRFHYREYDYFGHSTAQTYWSARDHGFDWTHDKGERVNRNTKDLTWAASVGVSSGSSAQILPLLRGEAILLNHVQTKSRYVGNETLDGIDCQKVEVPVARTTYWIGKDDHLIRRIVDKEKGSDQIEVTTISPEPNARIPDDLRPWNAPPYKPLNTDAECRASSECKEHGKCHGDGSGECKATSDADCKKSSHCVTFGACTKLSMGCGAASVADCKSSSGCKEYGRCQYSHGVCTNPN